MNKLARSLVAALTITVTFAALLSTASATLAVTPLRFTATLDGCISGKVPQDYTLVNVVWRDSAGHKKAKFSYQTAEYGYWYAPQAVCDAHVAAKGDTIQAHVTLPSDITRIFKVRSVTGSFNRRTNVVTGTAPAAGIFYLGILRPDLALNSPTSICEIQVPVSGNGSYASDTTNCATGYDAIGGDVAYGEWLSAMGDRVIREMHAPYVEANLGTAKVDGYLDPSGTTSLTLRSKGGLLRGTAHAIGDAFGKFKTTIKMAGQAVNLKANNSISGNWEGPEAYKVRQLTNHWDTLANTAQGTCTPNTAFGITVGWGNTQRYLDGTTDNAGLTGVVDLSTAGHQLGTGDTITLICMRPNGDRTKRVDIVP